MFGSPHQPGQLEAVHAGHLHVQNSQRKVMVQQQVERIFARRGLKDQPVVLAYQRLQRAQVFRQVIDDQDFAQMGLRQVFSGGDGFGRC